MSSLCRYRNGYTVEQINHFNGDMNWTLHLNAKMLLHWGCCVWPQSFFDLVSMWAASVPIIHIRVSIHCTIFYVTTSTQLFVEYSNSNTHLHTKTCITYSHLCTLFIFIVVHMKINLILFCWLLLHLLLFLYMCGFFPLMTKRTHNDWC